MMITQSSTGKNTLCVCIPTFNRANRLGKALRDLYENILASRSRAGISVYVSDNGSRDRTAQVIREYRELYAEEGIRLTYDLWPENQGFDTNVLRCYERCEADYLWLLSDDDNIYPGALDQIMDDIASFDAGAFYYNFNQSPYGVESPWVRDKALYLTFESHEAVSKVVHWPKLSAIVLKRGDGGSGVRASRLKGVTTCGFMHIVLALQSAFDTGRLLLSNKFIACPDHDYLDHIDFAPYIFNSLNEILQESCEANGKAHLLPMLRRRYVSPLNSSLFWLWSFYFGKMTLTPSLKNRLTRTVKHEIRQLSFLKNGQLGFIKHASLFLIAYAYSVGRKILTGKHGTRIRVDNDN